jgi:probable F420-dependent oxidoreductase
MGIPNQHVPLHEQRDWFAELEDLGYRDLWSNEAYGVDGFTPLALASAWTTRVRLGCAVHPIQTRGPAIFAQSAAGLAQAAPGRFVLGVGSSSPTIVESWNAVPFEKPYQRMRDGLRFLRAALAGERIDHEYETFTVRRFQLATPVDPSPPIFAAALRPRMLALAGREADGVILNWVTVEDMPKIRAAIREGIEGRSADAGNAGADVEVALRIMICVDEDLDAVREIGRYAMTGTLTAPAYRAQQEWLGRTGALDGMWQAWARGNRKEALRSIPEKTIEDLIIIGPLETCRERIAAYFDAGVDTVILEAGAHRGDIQQLSRDLAPR